MDSIYVEPLVELGTSLTTLAVKGTATAINSRIKAIRDEKNAEKIRATYDEIVNELISEREEAVRIAQIYKNEIERIAISDDDIQHLHRTVEKLLELLKVMSPNAPIETFEQIKELISVGPRRRRGAGPRGKRLRPPFLRLWGLFLLSGASRLRGRLPFHPISEMGAFISVKENQ